MCIYVQKLLAGARSFRWPDVSQSIGIGRRGSRLKSRIERPPVILPTPAAHCRRRCRRGFVYKYISGSRDFSYLYTRANTYIYACRHCHAAALPTPGAIVVVGAVLISANFFRRSSSSMDFSCLSARRAGRGVCARNSTVEYYWDDSAIARVRADIRELYIHARVTGSTAQHSRACPR